MLVYQRVCIELMMRFVVWPWPFFVLLVLGRLKTQVDYCFHFTIFMRVAMQWVDTRYQKGPHHVAGGHSDNGQSYNNAFMQPHLILACLSLLQRYFDGCLLPQYSTHRHFATEAIALNSFHVVVQYCPYLSPLLKYHS